MNVNILRFTVPYLNATIYSETQNTESEIGTNGSSQTLQNQWVERHVSGFGLRRVCRSDFWSGLEPNRPSSAAETLATGRLSGPIANTTLTKAPIKQIMKNP
jgi:hypothetical protein